MNQSPCGQMQSQASVLSLENLRSFDKMTRDQAPAQVVDYQPYRKMDDILEEHN